MTARIRLLMCKDRKYYRSMKGVNDMNQAAQSIPDVVMNQPELTPIKTTLYDHFTINGKFCQGGFLLFFHYIIFPSKEL